MEKAYNAHNFNPSSGKLFKTFPSSHSPSSSPVCIVLDHRGVNFLTIVRVNREAVTSTEIANYSYPRLNYS